MSTQDEELIRKNARTGMMVVGIVVFMVGLSFASVPLYSLFCRVTGFAGTTQTANALPEKALDRVVTVSFNGMTGRNMPWEFRPEMNKIDIHVGGRGLTSFMARNPMGIPVTGTAIYNVTPLKVGKYFNKIQCFCFDEQTLAPGEEMSMPVLFFIDPAFDEDPNMDDVRDITLSYTFYRTESKELEQAMDEYYNAED